MFHLAVMSDAEATSTRVVVSDEAGRVLLDRIGPYIPREALPEFAAELQRNFARVRVGGGSGGNGPR